MIVLEWIRFGIAVVLMLSGLFILGIATLGIFRFDYVLNRVHVAAKCDSLGALLALSSLMVMRGFSFTSLRLLLIIIFVWLANPVASHLVTRLEVLTNKKFTEKCEVINNDNI